MINNSLSKLLKNPNKILDTNKSENLGHNSIARVDFYQEENVRLGELLDAKKLDILKGELEKYQEQGNLISKINSVNDAINDTNVLTTNLITVLNLKLMLLIIIN